MDTDEQFIAAIQDSHRDLTLRLIYADWLDEQADPRAEFLRLQNIFLTQSYTSKNYKTYCLKERELLKSLDPTWIQLMSLYTTPPPCRDIAKLIPELGPLARTTLRLHPHRAIKSVPDGYSKIGGHFSWPANEPWPMCQACQIQLVPVLQLRSKDVKEIQFPENCDLFQLFWCPDESAHDYHPNVHGWWRNTNDLTDCRIDNPDNSAFDFSERSEGFVPKECYVYPESVIEFPIGDELYHLAGKERYDQIRQQIREMNIGSYDDLSDRDKSNPEQFNEALAFTELGVCPSSKLTDLGIFEDQGKKYEHLVTFSSWEVDIGSFRRWLSVEDQRLLAVPGKRMTDDDFRKITEIELIQDVTGMTLGRTQRGHVYICRDQWPWTYRAYTGD